MIALSAVLVVASGAAETKPRVAVVQFAANGSRAELGPLLTEVALSELTRDGCCELITQADLALVLGFERQQQVLGCSESNTCLAELAGAMNAQYLLVGQIGRLGDRLRVDLKLVDTKSARAVFRQGEFAANEDALADAVLGLVRGAARLLRPAPPAPVVVVKAGPSRVPAVLMLGGAVALGAGALGLGLSANGDYQRLKSTWNEGAPADPAAYRQTFSAESGSIHGRAIASDVLTGTAIVATGIGLWLLIRNPDAPAVVSGIVTPSGAAVSVGGRL